MIERIGLVGISEGSPSKDDLLWGLGGGFVSGAEESAHFLTENLLPGGNQLTDAAGWDGHATRNWLNTRAERNGYDSGWHSFFFDLGTVAPAATGAGAGIKCFTIVGRAGTSAAAKSGTSALDALAPAVRSNVDDAIVRAAAGKVRFPGHDGKVYNNSDGLFPRGGSYTEWTAAQSGGKRGAHRVIIEGNPANPNAIYYWDHVNPPVRIRP